MEIRSDVAIAGRTDGRTDRQTNEQTRKDRATQPMDHEFGFGGVGQLEVRFGRVLP